jgi:hypothetical protein
MIPFTRTMLRRSYIPTAVILGFWADPAAAQVIGQYFPSAVSSIGGSVNESVVARPLTEYDTPGIRAGAFTIRPEVSESFGFDSNPVGLQGGSSSPTLDTTASLGIASDWSRDSLGVALTVDDQRYLSTSQQDQTDWTASVFGSYDLGDDKLSGSYSHLSLNENATQIGAVLTAEPIAYNVDNLRISYDSTNHGRFDLEPFATVTNYDFSNQIVQGVPENFRNRAILQGGMNTRYELGSLRNLVLVVQGTHISYENGFAGIANRDSNGAAVLFGIDYSAAGVFRYQALVGYQIRQYESTAYNNLDEPIFEAAVTWTPTLLTTVTLSALRDIEDAADDTLAGYTYTTGRLDVYHELRRNIVLNAHVAIARDDEATQAGPAATLLQTSGSQTIYTGGFGATWRLNRNVRLTGSYEYNDRHSGNGGLGNYNENVALLTFTFAL